MAGDASASASEVEADPEVARSGIFPPVLGDVTTTVAGTELASVGDIRPIRDAALVGADTQSSVAGIGGGAAFAVAAHIAMVLLIVLYPAPRATWSGRGVGAGIEVELTSSRAFSDTMTSSALSETAEAAAVTPRPASTPEPTAEPVALLKPRVPDPTEVVALAAAPTVADTERPAPTEQKPSETQPSKSQAAPQPTAAPTPPSEVRAATTERRSASAGGALRGGTDSDADVIAPPGELVAYNRAMVEAIDSCKPRDARGQKGTVYINYVVEPDGTVGTAYVVQSSGAEMLDNLALEALRSCRLAAPLPGLPSSLRFYNIFYRFQ